MKFHRVCVVGMLLAVFVSAGWSMPELSVLHNGKVYVPLRGVAESLGAVVSARGSQISISLDGKSLALRIGSRKAVNNGKSVQLSEAPFLVAGKTYIPARFAGEALGATVTYDASQNLVRIAKGDCMYAQVAWSRLAVELEQQTSLNRFMRLLEKAFAARDGQAMFAAMHPPIGYYDDSLSGDALERELLKLSRTGKLKFNPVGTADWDDAGGSHYSIAYDGSRKLQGGEDGFMGNFVFGRVPEGFWQVMSITNP